MTAPDAPLVIPAKTGITPPCPNWTPAFAGVTE
jgi:hypothetical protein